MKWPHPTTTENSNGVPMSDIASSEFQSAHGLGRIDWYESYYGISNKWAELSFFGGVVGNTTIENWGLNSDYPMTNIAAVIWNENGGTARPLNLKWYDLEPFANNDVVFRRDLSNSDFEDPDFIGPYAPFQKPADIKWYGERVFLGEVTETITNITAYSVYHGSNDLRFFLDSPSSGGAVLRFSTNPQRVMVERSVSTYNESAYDYVRRTGRHIVTIERNDYDPGNEYIIAGKDNASSGTSGSYYVYPPVPSNSSPAAVDIPLINYSNNPADQDSLTVVTGENVTFRLYEDLI
jgi:hypothetical protein